MSVRNLLIVNAIYMTLVALGSILAPAVLLESNGMEVNADTLNLQRVAGTLVVGYAVASWLMRNAAHSEARRAFLIGGGIGFLVGVLVFTFNYFTSEGHGSGLLFIAISLLLGIAFLYFGFRKPSEQQVAADA